MPIFRVVFTTKTISSKSLFALWLCTIFFWVVPHAHAKPDSCATPYINSGERFYADMERLAGLGLIHPVYGHGNVTRSEARRLIRIAKNNLRKQLKITPPSDKEERILTLISRLEEKWGGACDSTFEIHPLNAFSGTFDAAKISSHGYLRGIDAYVSPLTQYQQGRAIHPGSQIDFGSDHWMRFTPHVSVYAATLLQLNYFNDGGPQNYKFFLQQGYTSFKWGNTQIDLGRREFPLGQSPQGGFLLSNNARPLDALVVSNPTPFDFHRFGKFRYSFFLANLGPEQDKPYAFLAGGKLTYQPLREFQFSIARAIITGGDGSPQASFLDYFREYFGARQQREFVPGAAGVNLSNSISGVEARATLPFLKNLNLYGELYFDDFDFSRPLQSLADDTALLLGAQTHALDPAGSWGALAEYRRTTDILYSHSTWTDGWTLNNHVLGDPLGSDASSLHVAVTKKFADENLSLRHDFYFEAISSNTYTRNGSGRTLATRGVTEFRLRNSVTLERDFTHGLSGRLQAGYESIRNFNFSSGDKRNDILGIATVVWHPGIVWR